MKSMRYVVIGIGKYGSRIALEMAGRGAEVFAIDCVEEKVEEVSDDIALAITMDSTDPKAPRSQTLEEMDAAVGSTTGTGAIGGGAGAGAGTGAGAGRLPGR